MKDITAPTFDFSSDLDMSAANQHQFYVSGTCSEAGDLRVAVGKNSFQHTQFVECDGSSWVTSAIDVSGIPSTSLVSVKITATMTDAAGNPAAEEKSKTVQKDTTSRSVAIDRLSGDPNKAPPINHGNAASYPVAGGCSQHTGDVTVTVGGTAEGTGECSDGRWTATVNVPSTVSDGAAIAVSASFGSGADKVSDATTALKDTVVPTLKLTPSPITSLNQDSYDLDGGCTGGQGAVSLDIGGISASANCASDAWQVNNLDVNGLTGSSITITVDVSDAAGNPAVQLSKTVTRDVEAPTLTITSAEDITIANEGSYTITGTCGETGTGNVKITIGSGTPQTIDCTASDWTLSPTIADIPEGLNLALVVEHWDSYENVEVVSDQTISKDTVPPTITITSDAMVNKEEVAAPYLISGECEGGEQVHIVVGAQNAVKVNCMNGQWEYSADLSVYSDRDQDVDVTVSQQDDLENPSGDDQTLEIDVTRPTLEITTHPPDMLADNPTFYIFGRCSGLRHSPKVQPVTIIINGHYQLTVNNSNHCVQVNVFGEWNDHYGSTFSAVDRIKENVADGMNIPVVVTMPDAWGNIGEITTTFNKDTIAPQVTITTPLAEITEGNVNSYPLSGRCTFGDRPLAVAVGTATPDGTVDCQTGGTWSASVNVSSLERGTFDVTASQTDTLDNTGDDNESITKTIGRMVVSVGGAHTCALKPNGQVACWGSGGSGRLGNGATANSSTPVDVQASSTDTSTLSGIAAISSGSTHTCAVTTGGNVKCWGRGDQGRLGDGATTDSSTPVDVPASSTDTSTLSGIAAISSGGSHTCALTEGGNVKCWGAGGKGRLGNGATANSSTPVDVQASSTDTSALSGIAAISSGSSHTCAVTTGGNVKCWGSGDRGRLGNGATTDSLTPVEVQASSTDPSALGDIAGISSGSTHTCAVTTGGNVKCWGRGDQGRLGNGATTDSSTPVEVQASSTDPSALGDIAGISSGGSHTCAVTIGGNVKCWGNGDFGQLGNKATISSATPVDVQASSTGTSALSGIAVISSGSSHSCALTEGGNVKCWGNGNNGRLGNGRAGSRLAPVDVHTNSTDSSALSGIAAISAGSSHTCALTIGGNVKCWGNGDYGQLGNKATADSSTPVEVQASSTDPSALGDIAEIGLGNSHSCAVTTGGNVKCWGRGEYGQLGNKGTTDSSTPVDVQASSTGTSALSSIAAISSGSAHTCAVTTGGNVKCWGRGDQGQLGNKATADSSTPVDVQASSTGTSVLSSIAAISSGGSHTCAVTTGGNVKCWGDGYYGQLGNNAAVDSSTPVDVQASSTGTSILSSIAAISSGAYSTCALTEGGNVKCWGDGNNGQLGNKATANSLTPVDVHTSSTDPSALGDIAAISTRVSHTCAVTEGGNVKCWGYGYYGQLGNKATADSSTPVDVQASSTGTSALSDIAAINAGSAHTCALTEGDNVKCWGIEGSGQLGNNGVGVAISVIGLGHH